MKDLGKYAFSWIPRLTLTVFSLILFVILFVVSAFLSSPLQAAANPLTNPMGVSVAQVNYSRTDLDDPNVINDSDSSKHLIDRSRQKLKQATEPLREQIGLEEDSNSTNTAERMNPSGKEVNQTFQSEKHNLQGRHLQGKNLTERK